MTMHNNDNGYYSKYSNTNIMIMIRIKIKMISVKSILIIDKWLTEYPLAENISHLFLSFSPHLLDRIFQTQKKEKY